MAIHSLIRIVIIGFVGGVALASFFDVGSFDIIFILVISLSFAGFQFLLPSSSRKAAVITAIILASFSFGVARFVYSSFVQGDHVLYGFESSVVTIQGIVVDEQDMREGSSRLKIRPIRLGEDSLPENTPLILIVTERYPEFRYGDIIVATGTLKLPKNFKGEQGREFDYVSYLKKDGITYQMLYPDISKEGEGGGNFFISALLGLKSRFIEALSSLIPDPNGALAGGLIVGAKQSLGQNLLEKLRSVGLIHIVVLSGYNITIIAESIGAVCSRLRRRNIAFVLSALAIILFALMVGASATVIRASIMALIVILARATGRTYALPHALMVAGFIMVLHNPSILLFDPSFQLSFMATIGLIAVSPILHPYFALIPEKLGLRDIAVATVSTQLFVLPLILWMTGELSLIAPFVNILVLPVIPLAMLLGALAGSAGMISYIIAVPIAYAANAVLSYVIWIVDTAALIPFASISFSSFSAGYLIVVYALYGAVLLWMNKIKKPALSDRLFRFL